MTRQMSCHENLPDPPARITRRICLPEIPPSPLKIPRQNMARQPSPPPHSSANGAGRGGQGVDPARLCTLNRYFSFSFSHLMNGHIFLYNTIHTCSSQSGLNKAVLRIHDILGWIRIRGSMPLTNGSGFGSGFGSGSWIRILLFSSLAFKMPAKN
jgi:hypothetical protein